MVTLGFSYSLLPFDPSAAFYLSWKHWEASEISPYDSQNQDVTPFSGVVWDHFIFSS